MTFGFSIFTQFLQVYLIQKFNYNQSDIGDYFGYIGICIAITQGFITRFLSKKMQPATAVTIFTLTLSIALILILWPQQSMYLYLISPFVAISQGILSPNLQTIVSNSGGPEEQGEILGINLSIQSLAQAIPPIVAGFIVSINMNLPIILASAFTFASWLFFVVVYKSKNK
jgi:DHA1 family tetracycline resistance protein-like MFS transporter